MSNDDKLTIFLTGATGTDTSEVRNADKARRIQSEFGVTTVVGALQDLDKLSSLSESAHVVFHSADCDDVDAIKAILSGMKARNDKTGDVPLLIHTSGLAEIGDDAQGQYASDNVYSDLDIAGIEALPPTALHRAVDLLIVAADEAGYVRSHIILPSLVYGVATGPLFESGISNAHTVFTPILVRTALRQGNVAVLNKGESVWSNVHIDDLANMYIELFDAVLATPERVSHGREGYFFCENGEVPIKDVLGTIAETLSSLGLIASPELKESSVEEMSTYYGADLPLWFITRVLFCNTRCKAERARRDLGWAPTYKMKDMLEGLRSEVEILARKEQE
ncbi:NAD-P-binding protein [Trametes polyzona]|nr:NAD-P-binding protein [Trametes polyzona]